VGSKKVDPFGVIHQEAGMGWSPGGWYPGVKRGANALGKD